MPEASITREEWASLEYPVLIRKVTEIEDGGYIASIPALGEAGFRAWGQTLEEAMKNLEEVRLDSYEDVVASGMPISLPFDVEEEELPSGRFTLRTSPKLHAELKAEAERLGMSFNAFCGLCLQRGLANETFRDVATSVLKDLRRPPVTHADAYRETLQQSVSPLPGSSMPVQMTSFIRTEPNEPKTVV